ncbi:hypothetical protein QJS66_01885 [Kocuria rhizophila]|nr:hypothetical protein QJS66_01885 [Kocuria rhizophila]
MSTGWVERCNRPPRLVRCGARRGQHRGVPGAGAREVGADGSLPASERPLLSSFVSARRAGRVRRVPGRALHDPPERGLALFNVWARLMGAHVGRGVWCETWWLPSSTWCASRTTCPSTAARSCRPTCSTTGSCASSP